MKQFLITLITISLLTIASVGRADLSGTFHVNPGQRLVLKNLQISDGDQATISVAKTFFGHFNIRVTLLTVRGGSIVIPTPSGDRSDNSYVDDIINQRNSLNSEVGFISDGLRFNLAKEITVTPTKSVYSRSEPCNEKNCRQQHVCFNGDGNDRICKTVTSNCEAGFLNFSNTTHTRSFVNRLSVYSGDNKIAEFATDRVFTAEQTWETHNGCE